MVLQPPLVSVVVPVYNGARFLVQTLQAVAGQTHSALELIVVDDNSSDDSVAAAQASGVRLSLIHQNNGGVSRARNAGLAAASGQYVCFLDQDDIWHPQHLERQLSCFALRPECAAVVSPYQHWYPSPQGYGARDAAFPPAAALVLDADFSGWVYHQFLLDCWALTSATMVSRGALLACGGFEAERPYGEDWDLWLRLSRQIQFAKLNWPPVLYRQHEVQGSRQARPVDHRVELLLAHATQFGLASRDGRAIDADVFRKTIARYQMDFGYHQLKCGQAALARASFWGAWRRDPGLWRALSYAAAGALGWRPGDKLEAPQSGAS